MKKQLLFILFALTPICATPPSIIAWDLHDVLLQRSGTLSSISASQIKDAVLNLNWPLIKSLCALLWSSFSRETSSEEYILLAQKYQNQALANIVINVANAQTIMPGMLDIVKKLHQLGYTQHVVSNIGKSSFQKLYQRNDPEIKEVFSYLVTDLNQSHVVIVDHDTVIKKPHPQFFYQYLNKNHLTPSQVIFIDDKKENIESAKNMGLQTIQFTNPDDLIKKLNSYGIALSYNHELFDPITMISTTTII